MLPTAQQALSKYPHSGRCCAVSVSSVLQAPLAGGRLLCLQHLRAGGLGVPVGRRYLVLSLHSLRLGQRGVDAQGLQGMTEPSGRRDNARLWGQGRSLEEAL